MANATPGDLAGVAPHDAPLIADLARARLATSWRLFAVAGSLAWLVVMTLWGFGRSTYPDRAGAWLVAGLAVGALVGLWTAVGAVRRLQRARAIIEELSDRPTA